MSTGKIRTVVEVVSGSLLLAGMFTLQWQMEHLQARQDAIAQAGAQAAQSAQQNESKQRVAWREQVLAEAQARIDALADELRHQPSAPSPQLNVAAELLAAKTAAASFRSEVSSDFARTKALVDGYMAEVRAKERSAALQLSETNEAIATLASRLCRDPDLRTKAMLMPTVQFNGDDTVGSGTIIWSDANPNTGQVETYALTSHHVVRNILADTPRAANEGIDTTIYLPGERLVVKAKAILSKPSIDAALVRLFTDRKLPFVASVMPANAIHQLAVWDPVCAVGCPLGNDPVPSNGELSSLKNDLSGTNYWMINAPTYFGNSGGGVYLADTQQLIGVFSKIYTHGKGNPVVVPHMGLCTPISAIHEWLTAAGFAHLLKADGPPRAQLSALAAPPK